MNSPVTREEITPNLLRELLVYQEHTGSLIWRSRDRKWFKNTRSWKIWNSKHAGQVAFAKNPDKSIRRTAAVLGHTFTASRVAWAIHYGRWPSHCIDHINGLPGDNRICNLRDVSLGENCRNASKRSDNTSGVTGVSWDTANERWKATISVNKRNVYLGNFEQKADAIAAREAAEIEFGYHQNHGRSQ